MSRERGPRSRTGRSSSPGAPPRVPPGARGASSSGSARASDAPSGPPKKRGPRRSPGAGRGSRGPTLPPALLYSLVGAGVLAALALAFLVFVYPTRPGPGSGRAVELDVPGDESPEALAARLASAGVIGQARLFALYVRARGGAGSVVRGAHLLADDLSPGAILDRLERSPYQRKVKITFPEGWTRFDMAKRLEAQRVCSGRTFLEATTRRALLDELRIENETAEGYLFPATYELLPDAPAEDVVRRLHAEFLKRYAAIEQRYASSLLDLVASLGWTRREIVTLASVVEKEAAVDDERPLIASVFLNRLRDPTFHPKLLQSDPTAAYACLAEPQLVPSCAAFAGKVTHNLLQDATNRYNTYKHEGLPPGPIANPGAKSLGAVLSAPPTRFLYFVAKGEGRHTFSETYAAHMAAIRSASGKAVAP